MHGIAPISSAGSNKKLDLACALCGILALVLGLITMLNLPLSADLPAGFRTPIIAFEFASSESDLSYLAGNGAEEAANRASMVAGTYWDMAFPVAYSGFLALLLLQLVQRGWKPGWVGIGFAVLIVPLDINENIVLLQIVEALDDGALAGVLLVDLQLATWLKWGAIAVTVAVLGAGLIVRGNYWSGALSGLTALIIGICWLSNSSPVIAELMSLLVSVFFLIFTVRACLATRAA